MSILVILREYASELYDSLSDVQSIMMCDELFDQLQQELCEVTCASGPLEKAEPGNGWVRNFRPNRSVLSVPLWVRVGSDMVFTTVGVYRITDPTRTDPVDFWEGFRAAP